MALSKRGESASDNTSSRRMRCIDSSSGADSVGIRSGRSFALAVDMTISSPRSIGSILEYFSVLGNVEYQLMLVNPQIDRPVILDLKRERGSAAGNQNI